jgi:hypothetical protein
MMAREPASGGSQTGWVTVEIMKGCLNQKFTLHARSLWMLKIFDLNIICLINSDEIQCVVHFASQEF